MKHSNPNLQSTKQLATVLTGGALALEGLRRRGVWGTLLGVGGVALAFRGARGGAAAGGDRRLRDVARRSSEITCAVTIQCPISEVYSYFRDQKNLEAAFPAVERIEQTEEGNQRWTLRAGRARFRYETTLIADEAERRLEWVTLPGGDLAARTRILFREAPGERGTEVLARFHHAAAGMLPRGMLAPLFRRLTRQHITHGLGKVKQQLEAGEQATNRVRPERRVERPEERPTEAWTPGLEQQATEVTR